MKTIRRSLAVGVSLCVLAPLVGPATLGASPAIDPVVTDARAWLEAQQQADGSFELSGFPGFETPDATFALAALAQTGSEWDAAAAASAVTGIQTGGNDPLDALDALVDSDAATDGNSIAAGARAAKIITLVTTPLGLDATDFDPAANSASAVDLVARMNVHRNADGSYNFGAQFNGVLFAAVALDSLGEPVPAALVAQIAAAQRSDGSWDYTGGPSGPGDDIDTTAMAVIALASAGLGTDDATVDDAARFLAARQQASGAWAAFGTADPNSTALATMALSDVHVDVTTARWRAAFGSVAPSPYVSPYTWLRSQQASDGHIASANDTYGVNTFATSQSLQALGRQWFLADERYALLVGWAQDLGSPQATVASAASVELGSGELGPNPSVKSARTKAAQAVVYGDDARKAAAADLFAQAFGRPIDPLGEAYWSTKLIDISRTEMLARLTGSSEFYRKAGSTIPTFVDAVYLSVLGRPSDPSGRAYWIRKLEGGASVRAVARSQIASAEFRRRYIEGAYEQVLDRAPSMGERHYWSTKVATTRIEFLLQTLAASDEYYGALER